MRVLQGTYLRSFKTYFSVHFSFLDVQFCIANATNTLKSGCLQIIGSIYPSYFLVIFLMLQKLFICYYILTVFHDIKVIVLN